MVPLNSSPAASAAWLFVWWAVALSPLAMRADDPFAAARERMVEEAIIGAGIKNPRVIEAMKQTPRHLFVAARYRDQAYLDMSLPIGEQQTISSPFIVAFMTEALDPQPTDKVLEIGTGSGYQAAVLSPLVAEVYTIEIIPELGRRAQQRLRSLRYRNVHVKIGDGYQGWPEHAPFDKIIVTCSPETVPQPLVDQLKEGGLMVIPVGERYQQTLYLMRKKNGKLEAEALRPTLFVPMLGTAEQQRRVAPDPLRPALVNAGFEEEPGEDGFVPGWYYQRQCRWQTDPTAPEGQHYVTFANDEPGRPSHLMQGFPIDGRRVIGLRVAAQVKHEDVRPGRSTSEVAVLAISFYDAERRDMGFALLGPFYGTQPWHRVEKTVRVPPQAREAILRIGLFGATGSISFDQIALEPILDKR